MIPWDTPLSDQGATIPIIALLDHLGLRIALPDYDPEAVWEAMTSDKKKRGKSLRFVLPLDIGQVDMFDDVLCQPVLAVLKPPV